MHFEGILKGYLKAVATGSTGPVAGVWSKLIWLGPVSGLFPVHATGPLNTTENSEGLIRNDKDVCALCD